MANKNNTIAAEAITNGFKAMLRAGHFPQVEFKEESDRGYTVTSYSMMEYVVIRSKLATIVHNKLVAAGFADGIFASRLRSAAYQNAVKAAVDSTSPADVSAVTKRLGTMFD